MTGTTQLLILLLIAVAIWLSWRRYQSARALLQDWADANGLRILHAKFSVFVWSMPLAMMVTTSRGQVVYHVSVYDESTHRIRSAWVRLGTYLWGAMNPDAIEVKWEDAD